MKRDSIAVPGGRGRFVAYSFDVTPPRCCGHNHRDRERAEDCAVRLRRRTRRKWKVDTFWFAHQGSGTAGKVWAHEKRSQIG